MMKKVASILSKRIGGLSKGKMNELAEKTSRGELSSFSAIFGSSNDPAHESTIRLLLEKYAPSKDFESGEDFKELLSITREVKAITNQAAILHGERIKHAQDILKKYRDGAFSSWLLATYGNRQTPYNFLQYYEFYKALPENLHPQIESMPRQAIYTLASRKGDFVKKEEIIKNYQGETKEELITMIRASFPLDVQDKRKENIAENALFALKKLSLLFKKKEVAFTKEEKNAILALIDDLYASLNQQ